MMPIWMTFLVLTFLTLLYFAWTAYRDFKEAASYNPSGPRDGDDE